MVFKWFFKWFLNGLTILKKHLKNGIKNLFTESACARSCLFLLALSEKLGILEGFGTPEFVKREISNSRVRQARNLQLTTSSEQKYEL